MSWPLTNGVCCDVSSDAARAADTTCTIATSDSWTVSGTCSITKVFSSLGTYTCDLRQGVRERQGAGGEGRRGGGSEREKVEWGGGGEKGTGERDRERDRGRGEREGEEGGCVGKRERGGVGVGVGG